MTDEFSILNRSIVTVGQDAEAFESFEKYKIFIESLTEISDKDFKILVEYVDEGQFLLIINEENFNVKYNEDDEWFDESVIEKLNLFIKIHNFSEKRFCFIEPYGVADMDQCINIAFLDKAFYDTLVEQSYALARLYHFN